MSARLRFWLRVMDLLPFGSRPYLWALRKASDATDWGDGEEDGEGAPW